MPNTVLVIDHSVVSIDTISFNLTRLGYEPSGTTSIDAAVRILSTRGADYVVLNLGLASSAELPEIQRLKQAADCTLIVVPHPNSNATVADAMAAGVHGTLVPSRASLIDYETALIFAHECWSAERQVDDEIDGSTLTEDLLAELMRRAPLAVWTVTPRADLPTTVCPRGGRNTLGAESAVGWSSYIATRISDQTQPSVMRKGISAGPSLPALGGAIAIAIRGTDGQAYGTLCGLHTSEIQTPETLISEAQHTARFVAGALALEEKLCAAETQVARGAAHSGIDRATGLLGVAAFEAGIDHEDRRARRHGHHSSVAFVSIPMLSTLAPTHNHASNARADDLARTVCASIVESVRSSDPVFRISPSVFAVIAAECDQTSSHMVQGRIERRLGREEISHTITQRSSATGTLRTAARDAREMLGRTPDLNSAPLSLRLVSQS